VRDFLHKSHTWVTPLNIVYGAMFTAVMGLFVGLFAIHVQKNPLRLDETDYFQCMHNVTRLGIPLYYAGEIDVDRTLLLHLSTRQLGGQTFEFYRFRPETGILKETFFALTDRYSRYTYGMWHPPLYIYLGGLFVRIFPLTPDNSVLLRYFNLVFSIGIVAGLAVLSRQLYPSKSRWVFLVALGLYTLNSLAVRGSLLIDYNATLGPCVTLWFVSSYLHSEYHRHLDWKLILMALLVPFTSLGIAASQLMGVLVYMILFFRRRISSGPVISTALGTIIFFPAFWVFCRLFQLPFTQPFLHNISRAGVNLSLAWLINQIGTGWVYSQMYIQEIGVWVVIMFAGLFARAALTQNALRSPTRNFVPILVLVGLCSQAGLGAEAYGFPKYILFLLPLIFVYLAGEALNALGTSSRTWRVIIGASLAIAVLTTTVQSVHTILQPGSTLYNKGEQGIMPIAQVLRADSSPDEIILSAKDVGFFAERKFVQWTGARLTDTAFVRAVVNERDIRYLVVPTSLLNTAPDALADFLSQEFSELARFDSFVLLKKK
jgi:hypothetical protein